MGLFRPRAPKAPEAGARFHFHFASAPAQPSVALSTVQLDTAIQRVQAELTALRATVAAAHGLRSAHAIEVDISRAVTESTALSNVLERKRAQCIAGLIDIADVDEVLRKRNRAADAGRAYRDELQRRTAADAAQSEIDRIFKVIV